MEHPYIEAPGSWSILALGLFALVGGGLLHYGWQKRNSKVGQAFGTIGASMLSKAIEHPKAAEVLGPLYGFLKEQLSSPEKLLASSVSSA